MSRTAFRFSTALIISLISAVSSGQPPPDAATAAAPTGSLHLVLFVEGNSNSLEGIGVSHESGARAQTNAEGAARLQLPEGEQCVRVSVPATLSTARVPFEHELCQLVIVANESTQALLTLDASGQSIATLDIMAPREAAVAREAQQELEKQLAKKQRGTVRGSVLSFDKKAPVPGARVFVRGLPVETTTDSAGRFELTLPEGTFELSLIHSSFSTLSRDGVEVRGDEVTQLKLELTPSSAELADFVIVAPHVAGGVAALIVERRQSSNVTDVIGAEEMSRSGASDAASALKRVTGINVVGGKFVYVRGMGERYSATLLNGQMVPSPDPERRVVPLDLFPTQVLESVVIQKTFSPDMPAEFGGGMVQLRTRSYPEALTFQLGVSVGLNTQTTFRDGPVYEGGELDLLGTDDGTRALPDLVRDAGALRARTRFDAEDAGGQTPQELQALGRAMPNLWNIYQEPTPLDRKLTLTIGNRYEVGSAPVGFLASALYSNTYSRVVLDNRRFVASEAAAGGLQLTDVFRVDSLEQTITSGGILALGAEPLPGHEIKSTTLLLRVTDDRVDLITGFNDNIGRQVRGARLRYIERQLLTEQVSGHHTFKALGDSVLDWTYAYATATLDDPDRREYFYYGGSTPGAEGATFALGEEPERVYTELEDQLHNLGFGYLQPIPVWSGLQAKAKLGLSLAYRDRESNVLRYKVFARGPRVSEAVNQQAPEEILRPENYGPGGLELGNVTDESDTYTADQRLQAAYAMAELPLAAQLELMGGARLERSVQNVVTTNRFNPGAPEIASLENTDVLPAATATWRLQDDMALRGGFGRTLSRPEFRELADVPFFDVTTNTAFSGNPELERATIDNYDLRWEWYVSTDELISLGAFFKSFDRPIELIAEGGAGDSYTWANAKSATNYGFELEGRRRLGWLGEALDNFFLAFNLAYIQSDVDLTETFGRATSRKRPLQGQAPYLVNAQLGFDDAAEGGSGTSATLLYNVTGSWIAQVGVAGAPDIYQEPVHQLDFIASQRLGAGLKLDLKATNLLNPEEKRTQGEEVVREFRSGRSFTVGLSWAP